MGFMVVVPLIEGQKEAWTEDANSSGDLNTTTATFQLEAGETVTCTFTNTVKTGACCYTDKACQVQTEAECTGNGGLYQGDETACSPNPCDDGDGIPRAHRSFIFEPYHRPHPRLHQLWQFF